MKKTHILALLLIAAGIYTFISASADVTTYATFADALQANSRVKIGGQLVKDAEIIYNPDIDPNKTIFHLEDTDSEVRRVILTKPKPQDFELSESVVVTGKMQGDDFLADEILVKCPSKYKEEEIRLKAEARS